MDVIRAQMAADVASIDRRPLTLDHLDGRTTIARRARDLVREIEADLGGADRLSAAERQLVQRAAVLGAIIESNEATWLLGQPVDVAEHLAAINAQRRLLTTVGLARRARDITPDPLAYARARAGEVDA